MTAVVAACPSSVCTSASSRAAPLSPPPSDDDSDSDVVGRLSGDDDVISPTSDHVTADDPARTKMAAVELAQLPLLPLRLGTGSESVERRLM